MAYKSTGYVARKHGVTSQTIRNWVRDGILTDTTRTAGGQLRIRLNEPAVVGYARVSSKKQASSLETQTEEIKKKFPKIEVVSDIGSGFNFKRPKFRKLLERAMQGDAITVVVANQDRLAREGLDFVRYIVESAGGSIVALDKPTEKQQPFDVQKLMGFITSFCNSYYGRRGGTKKRNQSPAKA